jgi:GntR family transcriptional regulator / MocR family aminotransferase
MGTNSGPELLVELDRRQPRSLRLQLENGLREAVRGGRLRAGARMPATRTLAVDLGVSRRLVVDAYAQLLAEGYLIARRGAGTFVAEAAAPAGRPAPAPAGSPLLYDFFPGNPDLASFPRREWLRSLREAVRDAPDRALGYPDPRGAFELREALAEHLRRVRGVVAEPDAIIVSSGVAQALALVGAALAGRAVAVEDPCLPVHRTMLAAQGARPLALEVDGDGARVELLAAGELAREDVAAVLLTPAHQSPTGVALSRSRRAQLLAWSAQSGALVIEDDYDAEFRYDRPPLGALQGLAPEQVLHLGTVSKTLAPALRLGWMVAPAGLSERLIELKLLADHGSSTLEQLALARMLASGAYDRHLRGARRRYRARRDALVRAVSEHLPGARVTGLAAGLHAIVRLAAPLDGLALMQSAAERSVGVYPLGYAYEHVRAVDDDLVLGYANLAEPAIEEGIRRLGEVIKRLPGSPPAATNEGGAIAR